MNGLAKMDFGRYPYEGSGRVEVLAGIGESGIAVLGGSFSIEMTG